MRITIWLVILNQKSGPSNTFEIYNEKDKLLCKCTGKILGWNFKFLLKKNDCNFIEKNIYKARQLYFVKK